MAVERFFADVILPLPLPKLFTYAVPGDMLTTAEIGKRAVVQFGSKKFYTAIITRIHRQEPTNYKVKEITSIPDNKPVVNEQQLRFWQWISEYYMCAVGEVMKAALPPGLLLESETKIFCNNSFGDEEAFSEQEFRVYSVIKTVNEISLKDLALRTRSKNIIKIIKLLYKKGAIKAEENLKKGFTAKTETYVRFSDEYHDENKINSLFKSLKRAQKQEELLENYLKLSNIFVPDIKEVKKSILLESCKASPSVLQAMVTKGIFELYRKETSRLMDRDIVCKEPNRLNNSQSKALNQIKKFFFNKNVVLLHGITSSGKTEIYIHLIKKQIELGKQVLYLLPEIAITVQIINRLRTYFGDEVGVYHSGFSDNERAEIWQNLINTGKYKVILGVRSSVFLPFQNLGLIIVDEEHENTFKQIDSAPRYHARDTAIMLAHMVNAKVLLGSATPSYESYFNALNEKYGLVNLIERYQGMPLPEIKVINTRVSRKKENMKSHFSGEMLKQIEKVLNKQEQVIVFHNRRGFAPYIECADCGWIPLCKHCDVTLTFHKNANRLICHYCGFTLTVINTCGNCQSNNLHTVGFGTEKIDDEFRMLFPDASIARMDLDTTRSKFAYEKIISGFELGSIDILVGTQMITKGFDFDNVGLVGILNADNMINFPNFRAYERSFQLMYQVSGRAGRKEQRGLVIIQTGDPGNPVIQKLLKNDYEGMFREQITERKQFKYPPWFRLIKLTVKHRNKEICSKAAEMLAEKLRLRLGERVIGPDLPLIGRIQELFLKNILLKIEKDSQINKIKIFISDQSKELLSLPEFKNIRVIPDVDPV
jgi:primosomal protein N' (replication factor Y)